MFEHIFIGLTSVGLPVGAIPFPDWLGPNVFEIGSFSLKWYGLAYVVGWAMALWLAIRTVARHEFFAPPKAWGPTRGVALVPGRRTLEDFAYWLLFGIIIGGRLGSIILYTPEKFLNPIEVLKVWEGGMSFHGGFLGVCVATWLFHRRKKIELMRLADMAAMGAPIGLGLGRLANFVNQELWGRTTDVPWAFVFATDPLSQPRHPSQLYEAFLEGFVLWLIIFIAVRKFKVLTKPGIAAGLFIAGYGVFRMFVELFREPDADRILGLTRGMFYSMPMVLVGVLLIAWAWRRAPAAARFMVAEEPEKAATA